MSAKKSAAPKSAAPAAQQQNATASTTVTTTDNAAALHNLRHSLAHLLASAVVEMFPEAKLGVGPVIEHGFYYDFKLPRPLTTEELPKLEKRMRALAKEKLAFERQETTAEAAKAFFETRKQPFKVELIEDIEKHGTTVFKEIAGGETTEHGPSVFTIYKTGKFEDLCRGGHVENTSEIDTKAFKLTTLAGAYWRGDQERDQLTRIYGVAFLTEQELNEYLARMEEARKRDHKVLGKQLQLFAFSQTVGSGLPMYLPKGNRVRENILAYVTELKRQRDYQFVWTPHLAKESLYVQSGHLGSYDAMLPTIEAENERFVVKPMNCPHHFSVYNVMPHSYRDLPYRIAENATDYRNEKSGELNGLLRVRSLTQDDAHHVVRPDQVAAEIDMILDLTREVYEKFGFKNFRARISAHDPDRMSDYLGDPKVWDTAIETLKSGAERWGAPYFVAKGEAAFYGPKIDIMVEDAIGREWQLTTLQLDYVQPENFDLTYTGEDGQPHRAVVLHAAILGSLDRFMGIVIEHFGGAFPFWLAPIQAKIVTINEKVVPYAEKLRDKLKSRRIWVELDDRNESLGKKIRDAEMEKVPHILVIGEKEAEEGKVTLRKYGTREQATISMEEYEATLS